MKKAPLLILKWLFPALLALAGLLLNFYVYGHRFLGMICICLAALVVLYYLIGLLKQRSLVPFKLLRMILTIFLCLGLLVFGVTEFFVIRASKGVPDANCPYLIVLGAKVNGTEPSISLSDRIDAAEDYLRSHPDTVAILSGGQGDDEGISEAQCMFHELTARGIPESQLWLEDKATSTWENIVYSLDLIEARTGDRPTSVGLLSSEYHLFRASLFARDCGVEAIGIPAATSWPTIRLNYFLREVAGIWHYILLGGQYL